MNWKISLLYVYATYLCLQKILLSGWTGNCFPTFFIFFFSCVDIYQVLIKNIYNDIQRIGQVFVLDNPDFDQKLAHDEALCSRSNQRTQLFPSYSYSQKCPAQLDQETVYFSPLLIFNLSLHVFCLKSFIGHGKESLSSLFEAQFDNKASEKENASSFIRLELKPLIQSPKYATHVRISFVRVPACNTLEFFKKTPSIEEEDRQELIEEELKNYFCIDRFLSKGDIFSISINWDCKSPLCASCNRKMESGSKDTVYFKVTFLFHITILLNQWSLGHWIEVTIIWKLIFILRLKL